MRNRRLRAIMNGIDTESVGEAIPALAALGTGPGDGHLYAVARDGRVWTRSWRDCGRPDGWSPLGPPLFPAGAEVVVLNNRLQDRDLFVLGLDGRLWNTCWVTDKPWKQWRRWEALGQHQFPAGAGLAATTVANTGDVAAFVVDGGGRLWTVRFPDLGRETHGHWSGFSVIEGPPLAADAAVCAISSGHGCDMPCWRLAEMAACGRWRRRGRCQRHPDPGASGRRSAGCAPSRFALYATRTEPAESSPSERTGGSTPRRRPLAGHGEAGRRSGAGDLHSTQALS